jgi:zinc D-Ala-D-Ala carboxypeptidase
MGDLSAHFSRHEFDCHDGSIAHPDPQLIAALERLRELEDGRPIHIVSGFRSAEWNRHVGGAEHSQHLYNRAADLAVGVATYRSAIQAGFTGIGMRGPWAVHVDVRPGRRVVFAD